MSSVTLTGSDSLDQGGLNPGTLAFSSEFMGKLNSDVVLDYDPMLDDQVESVVEMSPLSIFADFSDMVLTVGKEAELNISLDAPPPAGPGLVVSVEATDHPELIEFVGSDSVTFTNNDDDADTDWTKSQTLRIKAVDVNRQGESYDPASAKVMLSASGAGFSGDGLVVTTFPAKISRDALYVVKPNGKMQDHRIRPVD